MIYEMFQISKSSIWSAYKPAWYTHCSSHNQMFYLSVTYFGFYVIIEEIVIKHLQMVPKAYHINKYLYSKHEYPVQMNCNTVAQWIYQLPHCYSSSAQGLHTYKFGKNSHQKTYPFFRTSIASKLEYFLELQSMMYDCWVWKMDACAQSQQIQPTDILRPVCGAWCKSHSLFMQYSHLGNIVFSHTFKTFSCL
jgi:hypothetical protein